MANEEGVKNERVPKRCLVISESRTTGQSDQETNFSYFTLLRHLQLLYSRIFSQTFFFGSTMTTMTTATQPLHCLIDTFHMTEQTFEGLFGF